MTTTKNPKEEQSTKQGAQPAIVLDPLSPIGAMTRHIYKKVKRISEGIEYITAWTKALIVPITNIIEKAKTAMEDPKDTELYRKIQKCLKLLKPSTEEVSNSIKASRKNISEQLKKASNTTKNIGETVMETVKNGANAGRQKFQSLQQRPNNLPKKGNEPNSWIR